MFAALCAFFFGVNAFPAERLGRRGWNPPAVLAANFCFAVPVAIVAALLGRWSIDPAFWLFLVLGMAGNYLAFSFYFEALRNSPPSIVLPLISLSPVFMTVTSWAMLGERISLAGLLGILFVVTGAWFLGTAIGSKGVLTPLKSLWQDHGSRYALGTSLVWSVTANIDKICIQHSDPFTYVAVFTVVMAGVSALVMILRNGRPPERFTNGASMSVGLTYGIMLFFQMSALAVMPVPYVIAIKRTGMLLGVGMGVYRREKGVLRRLSGACLMLTGLGLLLALS